MSEVKSQMSDGDRRGTSQALQKLFAKYTHLPLGGKEISCPYWRNDLKRGIFGPGGGKGRPEEIVEITEQEAKKEGLDLGKMNEEEIISFMEKSRIGIDCSGFVFWMMDVLDKEKGGHGITDDIPGCQGKFLCRANVKMLTSEEVTLPIEKVKDIRVGDIIRLHGGKHVTIVIRVIRGQPKICPDGAGQELGEVREIEYAHSSGLTETSGVHSGRIIITDPDFGLEKQTWQEKADKGENYGHKYYLTTLGDGVKRLKIWA